METLACGADDIDALLPQTQCTRCGYPACRPYADAIADGSADINRCPPGGDATIAALSALTGRAPLPLDPGCGEDLPVARIARVVEADCIGCTKCIQACPVDAIVGAANLMHSIVDARCTGCELCIPPCPVDCIVMLDAPTLPLPRTRSGEFRQHYDAREHRLQRYAAQEAQRRRLSKPATAGESAADRIAAALARARQKPAP